MKLILLSLILAASCCLTMAQRKHIIFDFDINNGVPNNLLSKEMYDARALTITDSVTRNGEKSVRAEVRADNLPNPKEFHDPKSFVDRSIRSEYYLKSETYSERWYGLSIFAPSTYLPDPEQEIVTQWHNVPDFNLGEGWLSPSLALSTANGRWLLEIRWDTSHVTIQNHFLGYLQSDLGTVGLNKWTDWVFHVKFSYKDDGIVEVFKNGKKIYTRNGPNEYNDAVLPYWKFGIYKWVYKDHNLNHHKYTNRTLYYSQIREGDQFATYKDVAP